MSYSSFIMDLKKTLEKITGFPHHIMFTETQKNNGIISRSICIRKNHSNVAPSIGLDYFYNEYESGRSIDEIAEKINDIYLSQPDFSDNDFVLTWEKVKNNVVYHLVNLEANRELTKKCPNIPLSDLMLIFKIRTNFLGIEGNITVTYDLLELLQTDFRTLVGAALENTPVLLPLSLTKISDILPESGMNPALCEAINAKLPLWIAGNSERLFGAAAVLYDDFVNIMKSIDCSDVYLLPSSVHEMLILGYDEDTDVDMLKKTVTQVNNSPYVTADDFLSDSVYVYSVLRKEFDKALISLGINRQPHCYSHTPSEPHPNPVHLKTPC